MLFAREVFGVELDPWQVRVLRAYGRGERRISIRACHGPGKTFIAAVMIWHQMLCRFPQNTVATAPSKAQLEDALVKEVKVLYSKLPEVLRGAFSEKQNRFELTGHEQLSFFSARTARAENPEALQGVHCDEGWVLLIADEASGVPEKIFEAAAGSMSGHRATTLLLSNPVRSSGFFFDTHHMLQDMWFTVHVTGAEGTEGEFSPRVDQDFVEDIARRYGEASNQYRVRVLGEFPSGSRDTIIPHDLIVAAQQRDVEAGEDLTEIWGVDIARFGDDECALVRRNKLAVLPLIMTWSKSDLMDTSGRIKAEYDKARIRPSEILIDVIGMGGGVVDRLQELGLPVRGVNVSELAAMDERFRNLRTELWYSVADWLASRSRSLPSKCSCDGCVSNPKNNHAEQLATELSAQRLGYTSTGKLMAIPKGEMKKELKGRSPNVADALVLTFASEPATLLHGSKAAWSNNWNEPVRRNRAVV